MNLELHTSLSTIPFWLDGYDEQEDELEDVHKGKLDPSTDDEGPGSVDDKNDEDRALETEDEDEDAATDERPYGETHPFA